MCTYCRKEHVSWAAITALALGLVLALACAFPINAYAKFSDYTANAPAAQELGTYDDPIVGSQLPDGNYLVTARTTSSMCIFYTNPANAEARDSKEQAILVVKGGSMTAVFYVSKAYNYLYMGTPDQAAAASGSDGNDTSHYLAGDPAEGYVPHLFAMSVSALNTPITFSAFSGGNNGNEAGTWYLRQVVFGMTTAEYQQIVMASRQEEEPVSDDSDQEQKQEQSSQQGQQGSLNPGNVNTSENNGGNGVQQATSQPQQDIEDSESEENVETVSPSQVAQRSEKRGVKMVIVNPEIDVDIEASDVEEQASEGGFRLTMGQILALALAGLLVVGVVAKISIFKRGCDQTPRAPSSSSEGEDSVIEP